MAQRPVRFVMVGGFLGAGKTTAIARLARSYIARGLQVGLVTNDQAYGLVDTQSLRSQGFAVGEVTGACFCCKFNDLVATASQLAADSQPDVILAEPVGSCTDLVATVVEPLRKLYADRFEVGSLAVLLKPEHGLKILSGATDLGFSPKAAYIFLKQLEEADIVAINKVDKLPAADRDRLLQLVRERFPDKRVLAVSARLGAGFEQLEAMLDEAAPERLRTPDVDYDIYAEGEAELGWLNAELRLQSTAGSKFLLDEVIVELLDRLRQACRAVDAEPAHLKLLADAGAAGAAVANLVSSEGRAELSVSSAAEASHAEITVNARVAIDPAVLTQLLEEQVAELAKQRGLQAKLTNVQSFRPGRPMPTHRMTIGH